MTSKPPVPTQVYTGVAPGGYETLGELLRWAPGGGDARVVETSKRAMVELMDTEGADPEGQYSRQLISNVFVTARHLEESESLTDLVAGTLEASCAGGRGWGPLFFYNHVLGKAVADPVLASRSAAPRGFREALFPGSKGVAERLSPWFQPRESPRGARLWGLALGGSGSAEAIISRRGCPRRGRACVVARASARSSSRSAAKHPVAAPPGALRGRRERRMGRRGGRRAARGPARGRRGRPRVLDCPLTMEWMALDDVAARVHSFVENSTREAPSVPLVTSGAAPRSYAWGLESSGRLRQVRPHDPRRAQAAVAERLYALAPSSYGNEVTSAGSPTLARDWKARFYGTSYGRLVAVKRRADPCNLLSAPYGVASDEPRFACASDVGRPERRF